MKQKSLFNTQQIVLVIVLLVIFAGCRQRTTSSEEEQSSEEISMEEVQEDVKSVVYPLPSPFRLSQRLDSIGASYIGNVLNSVNNIDNYFTEKSKALALGVYGADLAYAGTYDKHQDVSKYSSVVKSLVDDLGIDIDYSKYFDRELKEEVINNKDTLVSIVSHVYYDSYEFFREKSDPALSALMVTGMWVEGLYIATHISEDTYNNYEMVKLIYDQSNSLKKVIGLLDKFGDAEVLKDIRGALVKLQSLYESTDGSLNKEQLNSITLAIESIRESIIA